MITKEKIKQEHYSQVKGPKIWHIIFKNERDFCGGRATAGVSNILGDSCKLEFSYVQLTEVFMEKEFGLDKDGGVWS